MDMAQASIMYHVALVLLLLWVLVSYGWCHPIIFFVSLLYLYKVNEYCSLRFRKRLQFEERKNAYQRRLLSDSESVRWLNRAVEKVWPICLERIASQQFLLPIIPWFLDKYKPWTARKAVVQQLYLGRNPPMFTEIRVLGESADDDHLVLELGMNFLSADDMSAILAVQLRKRLGFGMWAKMHITGMHIEGKVLVGVKFLRQWPFLGRLRVCFVEPPYFNMTVKPIFSHGIDVTELPGIAGWLEKILDVAFEQTLVEPNMLVVDVEKFASAPTENWFTVDEKPPVAIVRLEILEAADMKPSDLNGLADPYVKGQLGPYRFQTKIQRKTLAPKWLEEFKIPIVSWEARNVLVLEVRDKDTIFDDMLGDCSINIGELKGGQRHDKWLPLKNIKMGRLHVAITIMESEGVKVEHFIDDEELPPMSETTTTKSSSVDQNDTRPDAPLDEGHKLANQYEPINIEGQEKTGIWVHRPGSDVSQTWEQREGRQRHPEVLVHRVQNECTDSSRSVACGSNQSEDNSDDEDVNTGSNGLQRLGTIKKGLKKIGSLFNRSPKSPHSTPKGSSPREFGKDAIPTSHPDTQAVSEKASTMKLVVDDVSVESSGNQKIDVNSCVPEKNDTQNPCNGNVSGMAENSVKQGGKSAYSLRSVLSRKGSKKRNEDQSEKAEGNGSKALDQSNDEDYPLVVGGTPIEVLPASDNNKESINFREVSAEENAELGNVGSIGT